jgi:DNA-directed RNA polymerase subunit M/transcription elongation factor TFIIS
MKQILILAGVVVALLLSGWGVRSCSQRVTGSQGLPAGVEYVFQCRACKHEFRLSPAEMTAAYDAGAVRGSGDGIDLFKCPQCGKQEAMQVLKGVP